MTGLKMKKIFYFILCFAIVLTSCGRKKKNGVIDMDKKLSLSEIRKEVENIDEYSRFDLSKTKIIIPDVDSITDVTMEVDSHGDTAINTYDEIKDKFRRAVYEYFGEDADESIIQVGPWYSEKDIQPIKYDEVTDSYLNECDRHEYMLSYNDGKRSMLYVSSGDICMINDDVVSPYCRMQGETSFGGFYLEHEDAPVAKYEEFNIDDIEGISYKVSGEEVYLTEAVSYVENYLKEDHAFVSSINMEYKVYDLYVYKVDDENYCYSMKVGAFYKNVPLLYDYMSGTYPIEKPDKAQEIYTSTLKVHMYKKDSINSFTTCAHEYEDDDIIEGETAAEFLPLRTAVSIVESNVSDSVNFNCSKIELIYRPEIIDNDNIYIDEKGREEIRDNMVGIKCHPVWLFKFTSTGLPNYPTVYCSVDATTGELMLGGGLISWSDE